VPFWQAILKAPSRTVKGELIQRFPKSDEFAEENEADQ
jgi:hypothetical protein